MEDYVKYRPGYPKEIITYLQDTYGLDKSKVIADIGAGTGISTALFLNNGYKVFAVEPNLEMRNKAIELLSSFQNFKAIAGSAENTGLETASIDAVVAGQAFHWFDFDPFCIEAKRVAKHGALLAIWTYNLLNIDKGIIDETINDFYFNTVGPYWDNERKYVDEGYQNIVIPFDEIKTPVFHMRYEWTLEQLTGYINTWSSVRHYENKNGESPMILLTEKLRAYWSGAERKAIDFPVFMRLFKIKD